MVDRVTVTVAFQNSDIESWLRSEPPRRLVEAADLSVARKLQLQPMHPGSTDVTMARWFVVEVPRDQVDEVLAELLAAPAVAAAYVKPPDALPG